MDRSVQTLAVFINNEHADLMNLRRIGRSSERLTLTTFSPGFTIGNSSPVLPNGNCPASPWREDPHRPTKGLNAGTKSTLADRSEVVHALMPVQSYRAADTEGGSRFA
jgi:hypothetical protein